MDFVQRNLINERNNLQIELAKAKLLIAQLNENAHVNAVHDALDDAEKHYDPQHGPIGKSYRNDAIPHFKIARAALDAAKATGVEGKHLDKANARYNEMMGMMPKEGHDYGPGFGGVWVPKGSYDEQTEYISSLENAVIALAESMNMSVEDLLNEGEKRNIRLQKALQKAGDNIRIGNTKLGAMDSHIRDVATTQGGSAGQAASNALYRQKGKTKSAVSQAIEKSTKLSAALDTSTNQVRNSRAARVARGSFSDSPNEQRQADRIRSIGNEPKERNWRAATSTDSLAAQGKLPAKKFGSPGDQRTNLSAMRSDAYDARLKHAKAQSDAARARNQANRPV